MRALKREQLISLQDILKEMLQHIRKQYKQSVPYCYVQIEHMVNNIEIYILINEDHPEEITRVLFRSWMNANDELLGIPACGLFDTAELGEACRFAELTGIVEYLFWQEDEEMQEDEEIPGDEWTPEEDYFEEMFLF